jgi:hypothetical protein
LAHGSDAVDVCSVSAKIGISRQKLSTLSGYRVTFVSAGLGSRVSWASSVDLPFPPAISLGGMLNGRASVEAADS